MDILLTLLTYWRWVILISIIITVVMLKIFTKKKQKIKERSLDEIKMVCKILFIDDKQFPVIDILKDAGWINTRHISDVSSLDQHEIRESQILFVDIQGVGLKLKFQDQGLGLITALRAKYPSKKVIAYSAEDQGKIAAFHSGLDAAHCRLPKNADPYQFQFTVERFAKEIFSLKEFVETIRELLQKELGTIYSSDEINKILTQINNDADFSAETIASKFGLQNAANLATVIQVFFSKSL